MSPTPRVSSGEPGKPADLYSVFSRQPERAALKLADAIVTTPQPLAPSDAADLRQHYTPEQIAARAG